MTAPATRLFEITELMDLIMGYSHIQSIVNIGKTCDLGHDYMENMLDGLVKAMLDPYFNYDEQKRLMSTLEMTDGVITGSSTLKVILPYKYRGSKAPNLNIIVPAGAMAAIGVFLFTMGYTCKEIPVDRVKLETVEACFHFRFPGTSRLIIITESTRPTVLNVLLEGKSTASMNAITARNIYCFYPTFTANGYAFCGLMDHSLLEALKMERRWGLELRDPALHPFEDGRKCGLECPRRIRKVQEGGIGKTCWNSNGREDVVLGRQRFTWKLNDYCLNPRCEDKEPELYY